MAGAGAAWPVEAGAWSTSASIKPAKARSDHTQVRVHGRTRAADVAYQVAAPWQPTHWRGVAFHEVTALPTSTAPFTCSAGSLADCV